jgi:cation-transporting ATPase E
MTGDGVNDVLAMKESNCGVAMAGGAQAASQVARLVLMDADFAAMPGIVAEGRRVINNIQRAAALFLVKNILSLGLAVICVLTGWSYPFQPFHLSVVSALTIGVPGFFLAMEPNYQRVKGKFLPTVLRQALPGGITNIIVTVCAYLAMRQFGLPQSDSATVCTAVLSIVGLMVLFQVSQPMSGFRRLIWFSMGIGLVGSFLILGKPFDLTIQNQQSLLVMAVALCAAVAVFFAVSRILRLLDHKKC